MPESYGEDYFRHVCQQAGVALILTDQQRRIRFWNAAATRLLGASPECMEGEDITSIVPHEKRSLAIKLLDRTLTRGDINELEFRYPQRNGDPMYLAVMISPVVDDAGQSIGVSLYARDVTRRIKAAQEAANAQKMAALGSLAGAIAHYFNNLLGGLVTSADFAQNSDNPETLHRALKSMASTLSRATKLTFGLLAFAEGDHSDSPIEPIPETIDRFTYRLAARAAAQQIRIETQLERPDRLFRARQIETVLDRLTDNAFEAMPEGGVLRFELLVTPDDRGILLQVSDTGHGIADEHLGHVFEPFFTTKCNNLAQTTNHTGLGLAVVHGIVKSLGGTVTLCSTPQDGTICSIWLPVREINDQKGS